jgi:hypothetical protein
LRRGVTSAKWERLFDQKQVFVTNKGADTKVANTVAVKQATEFKKHAARATRTIDLNLILVLDTAIHSESV